MLSGAVAMEREKDATDDAQTSTRQWADKQMPTLLGRQLRPWMAVTSMIQ